MEQIICLLSVIPIRRESNHRSEQVSQLLFGEKASIIQKQNGWLNIKTKFDDYQGWIEDIVAGIIDNEWSEAENIIINEPFISARYDDHLVYLPAGSELPQKIKNGISTIAGHIITLVNPLSTNKNTLIETAKKFLHSPYLWGGRTCFGIDCSGLTQIVYKTHGIALPRDAKDQARSGGEINRIEEAGANDLLFFGEDKNQISHVGIYLGNDRIIHASKSVRIDRVDEKGIFNADQSKYTHKLQLIRRII